MGSAPPTNPPAVTLCRGTGWALVTLPGRVDDEGLDSHGNCWGRDGARVSGLGYALARTGRRGECSGSAALKGAMWSSASVRDVVEATDATGTAICTRTDGTVRPSVLGSALHSSAWLPRGLVSPMQAPVISLAVISPGMLTPVISYSRNTPPSTCIPADMSILVRCFRSAGLLTFCRLRSARGLPLVCFSGFFGPEATAVCPGSSHQIPPWAPPYLRRGDGGGR